MAPKNIKPLLVIGTLVVLAAVSLVVVALKKPEPTKTPDSSPQASEKTSQPNQTDQASREDTGPRTVMIQNFNFQPAVINIKKGTTVTWTNQDSVAHTVTSDKASEQVDLSSPALTQGEKYSFTFNTVGTFAYHCQPHPNMHATIVVTE